MTESRSEDLSYIRAYRRLNPSESMALFLRQAGVLLRDMEFEDIDYLHEPRVYALSSLRVTLFERRGRAAQDSTTTLKKLDAAMTEPVIITTERRRSRPGVLQIVSKRTLNPLPETLDNLEDVYLQDGEAKNGKTKMTLRGSSIVDSTDEAYRSGGTELALLFDGNSALTVLNAQREVLEERAARFNVTKRLLRPAHQSLPLAVPFMVAPFDSEGQRDEFIDTLLTEPAIKIPISGSSVGPIQWQLKTQ